jgi:hypothetical protein
VSLEPHNTGGSDGEAEVRAHVEHALTNRPREWRVSIVGSRENYGWGMKILGPIGVERSYTWVGRSGEHQPLAIASVLLSQGQELRQVMFVSRGPPFSAGVDFRHGGSPLEKKIHPVCPCLSTTPRDNVATL